MLVTSALPSALGEMAAGETAAWVKGGPPGCNTCQATTRPIATSIPATRMVSKIDWRKQKSSEGGRRTSKAPDCCCSRAPANDSTRNARIPQTVRVNGFHFVAACANIIIHVELRRGTRLYL